VIEELAQRVAVLKEECSDETEEAREGNNESENNEEDIPEDKGKERARSASTQNESEAQDDSSDNLDNATKGGIRKLAPSPSPIHEDKEESTKVDIKEEGGLSGPNVPAEVDDEEELEDVEIILVRASLI